MWLAGGSMTTFVRQFSRQRAVNLRKINPKVPQQEAASIAERLYNVLKQNGPLSVSNTWNQAKAYHPCGIVHFQEAGIDGLNSKTHMKIMLKWMMGRRMLKLFCNQSGSNKKFLLCTLPEDPQSTESREPLEMKPQTVKHVMKQKKGKQIISHLA